MIAGKRYNGLQTDIWSSGVVLFAMICGYLPFEDPKTSNLYKKILNADYQIPKFVSNEGRDLIQKILNTDPDERFTITDIRAHPWFKQRTVDFVYRSCRLANCFLQPRDGMRHGPVGIDADIIAQSHRDRLLQDRVR